MSAGHVPAGLYVSAVKIDLACPFLCPSFLPFFLSFFLADTVSSFCQVDRTAGRQQQK
jgi:hypothetical protein